MIEHLVISGGANIGFLYFGTLKTLIQNDYIDMNNIRSIYCTSVGTLLAIGLTLNYELSDLEAFLIERPWHELYNVEFSTIARAIQEGGMFGKKVIIETIKSLLLGNDLSLNITLLEYYEFNKKEIHFFVTKYSTFELEDISYKTHPHWTLVEAVYASSCLPVLFDPCLIDNEYYIDGGVLKNYPLKQCLEFNEPETIFGLFHDTTSMNKEARMAQPYTITNTNYRLFEYFYSLVYKMWTFVKHERTPEEEAFQNHIGVECDTNPLVILESFQSKAIRKQLFEQGVQYALDFIIREPTVP